MKKWLLSGCLLTLMACGQVPQERIDSLKETIADYEENGAGAEMPEEFRALQESFAEVERSVEAEKEKCSAATPQSNRRWHRSKNSWTTWRLPSTRGVTDFRRCIKICEGGQPGAPHVRKPAQRQSPEPAQRDEGRFAARPAACTPAERTHESRNLCAKHEILDPHVEKWRN